MKKLMLIFPVTLILSGCYQGAPQTDSSAITSRSDTWETMLNASDIDGLVALYTDDARIMPPNGVIKLGRAAVQEEFGGMIEAGLGGELTTLEARVAGDIGYHVGTYALEADGKPIDTGKFVEIWHRGSDGVWRIASDIWNSDNPAATDTKMDLTHIMGIHRVGDPEVWLAAWRGAEGRRQDFAAHGAPHVHVMQSPDDPNVTGLVIGLEDPAAFDAWLNSEEGAAAAAEDTVDMSTLVLLQEVE